MLYFTQTHTRLTCVASQKSFMSLVWATAKAMNGCSKGSKNYLKPATAFVQQWLTDNTFSAVCVYLRPQPLTSQLFEVKPATYQRNVDSSFIVYSITKSPLAMLYLLFFFDTEVSFGFFSYPRVRKRLHIKEVNCCY